MMKLKMSHRRIQSTPISGGFGTSHIVNKGHALLSSKVEGASGEARFQWFTAVSKLQKRQIKNASRSVGCRWGFAEPRSQHQASRVL